MIITPPAGAVLPGATEAGGVRAGGSASTWGAVWREDTILYRILYNLYYDIIQSSIALYYIEVRVPPSGAPPGEKQLDNGAFGLRHLDNSSWSHRECLHLGRRPERSAFLRFGSRSESRAVALKGNKIQYPGCRGFESGAGAAHRKQATDGPSGCFSTRPRIGWAAGEAPCALPSGVWGAEAVSRRTRVPSTVDRRPSLVD